MSALVLVGALLAHCRHGAEEEVRRAVDPLPASPAPPLASTPPPLRPGPPEPLDVPALHELRGKRLDQLQVSADGTLLFTRWEVSEQTFDYRVVHLPTGKPVWNWRGAFNNSSWELELSPEGTAGFVFLPLGPEEPYLIFRVSGAPIPMTDTEFTGGAWASGGGWFGGPSGAYNADGTRRGKPVPDWLKVKEVLFMSGVRRDTLRYMHAGKVLEWDGQSPPSVVGSWQCAEQVERHRLTPSAPVRLSPDGRFIVWSVKTSGALAVCDGESGAEFELAPGMTPSAWADSRLLWWLDAGALVGMDVLTRESLPRITLPDGAKAVALAASIQPPALFVGTDQGRLLRIPLSR